MEILKQQRGEFEKLEAEFSQLLQDSENKEITGDIKDKINKV